jgi:hypothetical protein
MHLLGCPAVLCTRVAHKVDISSSRTFTSFHPFKLRSDVFRQQAVRVKHVFNSSILHIWHCPIPFRVTTAVRIISEHLCDQTVGHPCVMGRQTHFVINVSCSFKFGVQQNTDIGSLTQLIFLIVKALFSVGFSSSWLIYAAHVRCMPSVVSFSWF